MQKCTSYIGIDLQKKAKLLHRLTLSMRMQLPKELARHCWVAGTDHRTLTIITNDPSRASTIRFQQREILKQLNQELSPTVKDYLNQIKVKIDHIVAHSSQPIKARTLNQKNAEHIKQSAKFIKDLALKKALQKLAKRGVP